MIGPGSLKRNFLINLASPLTRVAVAFVSIPLYVHHVGNARYGVINLVWALLGYAGFLDLGMSRASINALSKLRDAPHAERSRVLVTTLTVSFSLGLVAAVIGYALADFLFSHLVQVPEDLRPEVQQALPWIAAMVPAAFLMGAGLGALESRERFGLANVITILTMTLGQIGPVVVAIVLGPSLGLVIPAIALASFFSLAPLLVMVYREEGPLRLSYFSLPAAKSLLGYGGWISVSGVLGMLIATLDQMIIGALVGVAAVAYYAVAGRLVLQSLLFSSTLARTLFPRLSLVSPAEARELASRALVALVLGYGAVVATAIMLTPAFFRLWLGAEFASVSSPLAQIMFVGVLFNSFITAPFHLLQAQGRPDLPGKMNAIEIVPFFAALWLATTAFGLVGAAVVWTLRQVVEAVIMVWLSGIPRSSVVATAPAVVISLVSLALAREIGPSLAVSLPAAVAVGVISVAVALVQSEELRRIAIAAMGRLFAFRGLRGAA
jgi:O-antigen/teichoic acid export membrane protein